MWIGLPRRPYAPGIMQAGTFSLWAGLRGKCAAGQALDCAGRSGNAPPGGRVTCCASIHSLRCRGWGGVPFPGSENKAAGVFPNLLELPLLSARSQRCCRVTGQSARQLRRLFCGRSDSLRRTEEALVLISCSCLYRGHLLRVSFSSLRASAARPRSGASSHPSVTPAFCSTRKALLADEMGPAASRKRPSGAPRDLGVCLICSGCPAPGAVHGFKSCWRSDSLAALGSVMVAHNT